MRIVCKELNENKYIIYLCINKQPIECYLENSKKNKNSIIEKLLNKYNVLEIEEITQYNNKKTLE